MLTVKVVGPSGDEVIFEASQVRKGIDEPAAGRPSDIIGHIYIDTEEGAAAVIYDVPAAFRNDGSDVTKLYVMNRQGSTIATYYV